MPMDTAEWQLRGWRQNDWELARTPERAKVRVPDVGPVPASVPGSVRGALLAAGLIPDPTVGTQSRASEWIEHRHWTYSTTVPDDVVEQAGSGRRIVLVCGALDHAGAVLIDETEIGRFRGSFIPHEFDLTDAIVAGSRELSIVFTDVPDGLGQNGWTSRVRDWKPRFNYGWDWIPRMVQIGIPETPVIEVRDAAVLDDMNVRAALDPATGACTLHMMAMAPPDADYVLEVAIEGPGVAVLDELPVDGEFSVRLDVPGARPWDVLDGDTGVALYELRLRLRSADGVVEDTVNRTVGFRSIEWARPQDAPTDAEPWLCLLNGRPIFLQGVNWVPIRADYADVTADQVRARLTAYRDLGVNLLRVWGGAALESDTFYRLCDELGLLVWQELPLSSSGLDNHPPYDSEFAEGVATIAESYAERRGHHASLALWGGGNELTRVSAPAVPGIPLDDRHPALAAARAALARADPGRRFVATSPLGPRFEAHEAEFGLGLHHDVHGPWDWRGDLESWKSYWDRDDAVLRSEVGVAGASGEQVLREHGLLVEALAFDELRELWTHSSGWWLRDFDRWAGQTDLAEWIGASQRRQADMLAYAARATKSRFPRSTGFIVWLGHDAFPCAVSLALYDYDGRPKPAAAALAEVFLTPSTVATGVGTPEAAGIGIEGP
jgi:beta-mannosidase